MAYKRSREEMAAAIAWQTRVGTSLTYVSLCAVLGAFSLGWLSLGTASELVDQKSEVEADGTLSPVPIGPTILSDPQTTTIRAVPSTAGSKATSVKRCPCLPGHQGVDAP